ncbi:MAG: hypothetical protein BGO96_01900 [Micrococcales bacterium 73-15]|nr:MAG: hypothetical protein BGO96_01900 [Micrococcales bacterium 73-15]
MTTTVIGAGYAGVMAANRLAASGEGVTVVTPAPWFVERIRLHAVAGGTRPTARVALSELLHPDVTLVTDTVARIGDVLELASGATLTYDTAIYAVGSGGRRGAATGGDDDRDAAGEHGVGPDAPDGTGGDEAGRDATGGPGAGTSGVAADAGRPGTGTTVHSVSDEASVLALRAALARRPEAPVTVVGAGLTGVELAGTLRASGRRVRLVTASEPVRRGPRAQLASLVRAGVDVEVRRWSAGGESASTDDAERSRGGARPGPVVDRVGAATPPTDRGDAPARTARTARSGEDRVEPADPDAIVVDATGFAYPTLAADSGLPTDALGRLLVDASLTVPGRPRILGAGDAVRIDAPGYGHLRPACATALPMGAHAADVILARAQGRPVPVFGLGYVLQCVDLGDGRGHIQLVHSDDTERQLAVTGRAGGMVKEAVCRMTLRWLTQEGRRPGSYRWAAPPRSRSGAA